MDNSAFSLHIAPLQGLTDTIFLAEYCKWYATPDACYTPFIRLEKGAPRRQDMARLESAGASVPGLIPQIIFKDAAEFQALSAAIKSLGFHRIDLNLGCPHPMQTSKGRGAGMIANTDAMALVCDLISHDPSASYSIKMRLGMEDASQWRGLMPILNDTPLAHITLHPRIASQLYGGDILHSCANEFIAECRHPVIFNGDLRTAADINCAILAHPSIQGTMVGRGIMARPSLPMEWKSGKESPREERLRRHIAFLSALFEAYSQRLCGEKQILQKITPFWQFLEPEIGRKAIKQIAKVTSITKYQKVVASIEI